MIRAILVAALALACAPASAADICMLPMVTQCTLLACMDCTSGADGVRYCRSGGSSCNRCTPDPSQWQCTRDDGTTYSKPLLDPAPAPTPAGPSSAR